MEISSANESRRKAKVAFLICNDVLVEVLSYFDRQQLAKLEGLCRRFHRIVVRCYNEAPFLLLEMECYVKEESRRFSKILSSTDTDDEIGQFQHLLVFFVFEIWLANACRKTPLKQQKITGKGGRGIVNPSPTESRPVEY